MPNSENTRRSAIAVLPVPDNSIESVDRQQVLWIYSGIVVEGINGTICVTWKHHPLATKYQVQRANTDSGPWTDLGTVDIPFFSETISFGTYYYRVRARYKSGWTAWSASSEPYTLSASFLPERSYSRTGAQFTAASDQYLSVASNSTLQIGLGVPFWVSLWWNSAAPAAGQYMCLVSKNYEFDVRMYTNTNILQFTATGLGFSASINSVTQNVWNHAFCYSNGDGTCGIILNGSTLATGTGLNRVVNTEEFLIGRRTGLLPFNGQMDNVLFGKPPTTFGDGTAGSLAHTMATALYAAGNGLPFENITAQQQSDWGIVSGWLDNSLTIDAFGSNTLTNNNGVALAAGKVSADAVDNDPVYFLDDISPADKDLSQETLANRPLWKENIINGCPVLTFDGTDLLQNTSIGDLAYPFALYAVFKSDDTTSLTGSILCTFNGTHENGLIIYSDNIRAFSQITGSGNATKAFTDTTGFHFASAVFHAADNRDVYLDGLVGTNNTVSIATTLTDSSCYLGSRRPGINQKFDGQIAFACIIPSWTLAKQKCIDRYVLNKFFKVSDLAVTQLNSTSLELNWTVLPLSSNYIIQKALSTNGPWNNEAIVSSGYHLSSGLTLGNTYYYRVAGITPSGLTAWSNIDSATTVEFTPLLLNPTILANPENSFSRTGAQFTAASSQYLSVANNPSLLGGGLDFWFSAWVKFDDLSSLRYIASFTSGGANASGWMLSSTQVMVGSTTGNTTINWTGAATGVWQFVMFWVSGGVLYLKLDNNTIQSAVLAGTPQDAAAHIPLQIGARIPEYHEGSLDNVLFGKTANTLGDGTSGSLAHTIATALYNSGNGLPFQDITAQQESDWGIVSGWLDNSLTADAFGSNTLTNNNGVTQAAGKVNAVAVDNDPTYFINDASTNDNDLTQVTLASRPMYDAVIPAINDKPAWVFDGTNDHMDFTPTFSLAYPFALYFVFKANSTSDGTIFSIGDGLTEFGLRVVSNMLRAYTFVSAPSYQSETAFTDTTNWHYASAVFESTTKRTLYLDGIAATTNTQSQSVTLSPSLGRLGLRTIGGGSLFSGSVSCGIIIPNWTLEKQQSLDTWVQSRFGL